ncbi:MAG: sigma-70 family RNA polymerase sigma factor [Actinobacteria bacterium]|nr:sigma-70 family RNA polymerase sigma factor [Actinomycetota bacterium]
MLRDQIGAGFDGVLAAAQTGAGWALERIWTAYAGRVQGYLRLHGANEPEDLTSDVFLGAFRTIGGFSGDEAAFRSWLFTIAHRRLLDSRRGSARRPPAEPLHGQEPAPTGSAEVEALRLEAEGRVRALCERLVPDQRDVLLLRLVADLTVEEVALALDKTPGAVKALQRRGLGALRRILAQEGVPL